MSQYLLNIAERSTGNHTHNLLPSIPVWNTINSGISSEFAGNNNIGDGVGHLQNMVQKIDPPASIPLQKAQQAITLTKSETKASLKNTESSYFSKYIEQVETTESNLAKINSAEAVNFITDGLNQKKIAEIAAVNPALLAPAWADKKESKINPEIKGSKKLTGENDPRKFSDAVTVNEKIPVKKQLVNSTWEDESRKKNILVPDRLSIQPISPKQPEQATTASIQNTRMNTPAPKLIIGKIVVEILPPKLPVPQKIITRVAQSPSKESRPKSNKLFFGLGQL